MPVQSLAEDLGKSGFSVCKSFLSPQLLTQIEEDFALMRAQGKFQRAGIGRGTANAVQDEIRKDTTFWIEPTEATPAQLLLLEKLDLLKESLNRTLFLGIRSFEGHYAHYPAGGFYKRHLDCFQNDSKRIVSLILYLNRNWQPLDGGQLRLYAGGETRDIDPVAGTLVCFLSRELEHEVLVSHRERASFTGWFRQ